MDYALIRNGTVENVIVADEQFIAEHGAEIAGEGGEWVKLDEATHVDGQRPSTGWKMSSKGARKFARPAGA